jgi:hypothetical protein
MGYALGALSAIESPVDTIEIGIDQPRREGPDGETYRTWRTTPDELYEFGIELAASVQLARQPDAAFTPGPHCQTCPGRFTCGALHDAALRAADADVEPNTGSFLPPPAPETLSADELGRRLEQAGLIRIWLNAIEQHADAEARRGNVPTGWKLVATEGNRVWRDGDLTMRQALREFVGDVTEDDLWERKPLSPAKLEKLLGKALVRDFVKAHATRPPGVALVRADDARPALSDADQEFEALA